jgi:hypothetical protein
MPQYSRSHVRTALFVDFDNMYLNLRSIDPSAGEAFATEPDRWLRWMNEDMGQVVPDATDQTGREILIRSCYLNPVTFGRYRPFFTRSAFRVVDCPSLTSRGKNSADIYMVLDIIDTLAHSTHFDEFILLSADADFTPVMLRLRAHDRRTVLLANGPSATALQSACDMVIPLEIFLNEALGISLDPASTTASANTAPTLAARSQFVSAASPPAARSHPAESNIDVAGLRKAMRSELTSFLAVAEAPVPMAAAAQWIRQQLGEKVLVSRWGGSGSFTKFAESMTSSTLKVSGPHPPGYLLDPQRHDPLVEPEIARDPLPAALANLAHRAARIVSVPQLTPDGYRVLFQEIACLSAAGPVTETLNASAPRIRDRCKERGALVSRSAVQFVLQGLQITGIDWRDTGRDASTLAAGFAENVIRLCQNARMELTAAEEEQLRTWITTAEPSHDGTTSPAGSGPPNENT